MASRDDPGLKVDSLDIARAISKGFANMREEDICTDFNVVVQGKSFRCHKLILASVSDYFKAMFTSGMKEAIRNETTLENIDKETFQIIIDMLYEMFPSGDNHLQNLPDKEVEELLRVADMLQMPCLRDVSLSHFAKSMTKKNCVERLILGKRLDLQELVKRARDVIMTNFETVVREDSLSECTFEVFVNVIKDEDLIVDTEASVWRAISDWILFDEDSRQEYIAELLDCCYLKEIDIPCLTENIAFHPAVRKNSEASALVQEAIRFRNHPSTHGNTDLKFRMCTNKAQVDVLAGYIEDEYGNVQGCLNVVDSRTGQWVSSVEHDGPSEDFACCSHGNTMYISGGNVPRGRSLYGFCGKDMTWTRLIGELPVPLSQHAMVATDEFLFAVSGLTDSMLSWSVFQYSLEKRTWVRHGDVAIPVKQSSAVCLNEKIYIIGGLTEDDEEVQAIQEYDIKSSSATIIYDLPRPCPYSQSLIRQNAIYTVTSNGDVYKFELPAKKLEELMTTADTEDEQPFAITVRENQVKFFGYMSSNVESISDNTGAEDFVEEYDTLIYDLTTGDFKTIKTSPNLMTVYGCASIVAQNKRRPEPPVVPPRHYQN